MNNQLKDASIPFTDTNFNDVIPNESVRTFGQLIADGVIPSGSILQDVEVFFFGELNTRKVAFSNVDPIQDLKALLGLSLKDVASLQLNIPMHPFLLKLNLA